MQDASWGFCFFNNAAVAAQHLRGRFGKVAILDVDTHAGNGTQDIFYERGDVLYVSIHTDPSDYTPFFLGYEDETGRGRGGRDPKSRAPGWGGRGGDSRAL